MKTRQPTEILEALDSSTSATGLLLKLGIHDRTHMQTTLDKLSELCGVDVSEKIAENRAKESRRREESKLVLASPRKCKLCGKEFNIRYSVWATGDYCSEACARRSCSKKCNGTKRATCTVCGAQVDIDKRASSKTAKCVKCRNSTIGKNSKRHYQHSYSIDDLVKSGLLDKELTRGLWDISIVVSDGQYLCGCVKNHPNADAHGHVLLHRLVIENATGVLLDDNKIVHHINENKHDNRLVNLRVLTSSEHACLHKRGKVVARHGSITMYKNHKCRCKECVNAYREYVKRYKTERKQRLTYR